MKALFTRKTFQYFDLAKKNKFKKGWFEKNKDFYEEAVKEPYTELLAAIDLRLGHRLPNIQIGPRKIARPLRPLAKAEKHGYVKAGAMFFLGERTTSQFEWNPGLFFHLGDEKEDNIIGMGLYGPSSRQIKRLRSELLDDWEEMDRLLADKKLKKFWGGLADEKYVRFPKDHSPEAPGAKYLWYKQFFLTQHFNRKEVTAKDFSEHVLRSYEAGLPLLSWIRNAVGIYDRKEMEREKRDRMDRADMQEEAVLQ